MPNEDTSLLNALNSYITCPVCKDTNEVETILKCGHLICKNCKTKRTKCSVCFSELSATRLCSPSIKFIKELSKELLKASTGEFHRVESGLDVGNCIIAPNSKGELSTRNDSVTIDNAKTNCGLKKDSEISNDSVKIENEISKCRSIDNSEINEIRNKDNNKKNIDHKKGIHFYRNYSKHEEERKVYRKILKGLGIVGIDKQITKFKSKHDLNAKMEKEFHGHLNTIISRLNDRYSNNNNLGKPKFNYCSKIVTDSGSADPVQNINMDYKTSIHFGGAKDGFGVIKCDLKSNGLSLIKDCNGLKRKIDSSSEVGPSSKTFLKTFDIVEDDSEFGTVNLDKKLGGIVDETEIVQRYLNPSGKATEKEQIIKDKIMPCISPEATSNSLLLKEHEVLNEGPPNTSKRIIDDEKSESLSKLKVMKIISEYMEEISPNTEEDGLQSDIMADMFHNVSNEIVVVGNTLCSAEKNTEVCDKSIDGSYDVNNHSVDNSFLCEPNDNTIHSCTIKNKNESKSGDNGTIVVSDSEDNVEDLKEDSVSDSSKTKSNPFDILSNNELMDCRIVLKNLQPLIFQSVDNDPHVDNDECERNSRMKKCVSVNSSIRTLKNGLIKKRNGKGKRYFNRHRKISRNNNVNLMQTLPNICLNHKKKKFHEDFNNFEGFTEDDILILTVKLALFKMNGCKYSKNLSSSSLFALGGKQILIKDVSEEERSMIDSPCCPNKISDLTIEISDSEDESCKSLVTSSVQTETELLTVTPGPSTSKIRPVSLVKLNGYEIENEKFMQNDVLDIRKTSPNTPLKQESVALSISQNSTVLRTTPVSRRQLSFMSPSFENNLQYQDGGASSSNLKATESVPNSPLNDNWQVLHNRMQYMIPSNSEDRLHDEFERSGISPTRLTFTTCGLNSKETALVTKLAQMTKSCLTKDFTHNTTHLVIGAAGRGRLEYYLAIAYRAFIVTMDWVTLCLALNKILPVTGFIPTEDEGPLKCLEPNSLPFVGFHVSSKILPTSSSYPISEITKTLLSLGGARVLPNLDAFHALQDVNYPRIFIYNSKSVLTQAVLDKCASLHILPIQFMWVYESIGAFRAIPVMDFLDIGIHSRTLIRDYRIPEQLACSRYPRLEGEFHPQILDERYQRSL